MRNGPQARSRVARSRARKRVEDFEHAPENLKDFRRRTQSAPPLPLKTRAEPCSLARLKILFVCGCLEAGVDGVGDYTTLLARTLIQRGHSCSIIAIADPHVTDITRADLTPRTSPGAFTVLRVPSTAPWPERIAEARVFRETMAADWVSFQLVLYGYDPRGICFGLGKHLRAIAEECPVEVMFHEIWIGEAKGASFKNKMVGLLQRHIVKDLLATLHPRVVHTHTPLYRHLLDRQGVKSRHLPLFANISPADDLRPEPEWLAEKWPVGWGRIRASGRENWWIFVLFGSIHPEWDGEDFWKRATEAARRAGKNCAFISIGRAGAEGERTLQKLRTHDGSAWISLNLGAQPAADVSQCLLAADFGVSPVPPEYLSKSSTAMAMIEHGLPVIVTRAAYGYRHAPPDLLDSGMQNVVRDFDLEPLQKTEPHGRVVEIADRFAADLQGAKTPP